MAAESGRVHLGILVFLVCALGFNDFSVATAEILKPAQIEVSSPREDLRKQIFSKGGPQRLIARSCEILATDPSATIPADPKLQEAVRGIIKSINDSDEKALRDHFNPRLKVKAGQVLSSLLSLKNIVGSKYSVTNYRIAALNSPDGGTAPIECEDTGVLMHPLYGYPLSAGVWLQASGEKEVARIFLELVPTKSDWTIGAWHVQQWTHAGKDFAMWYEVAQGYAQKNQKGAAFISADIASKLLDGGGFLVFPVKQEADTWRDKQTTMENFTSSIKTLFSGEDIVHVATLFVRDGAGVLMRFGIKAEMSANAIKDHCKSHLQKIMTTDWAVAIEGIRCGYNFPRESPKADGVLGGLYVAKTDAK